LLLVENSGDVIWQRGMKGKNTSDFPMLAQELCNCCVETFTSDSQCRMEQICSLKCTKVPSVQKILEAKFVTHCQTPQATKNPSSFSKNKSIRYKANYSKYQWTKGKQEHGGNMCMLGNQADAMIQWKF